MSSKIIQKLKRLLPPRPGLGGFKRGFLKLTKKTLVLYLIIAIAVPVSLFYLLTAEKTEAAWFDDTWSYRAGLTIGNTGSADSDKKVKFDVDTATLITAGKMQSDCGDSRFTDATGNLLNYYLDSAGGACNGASTDYYVLVPTIPTGNSVIYHYYGNPSAPDGTVAAQFSQSTFSPTSGPTPATEEKGPGPAAYWKFDDATGTTAQDSSQNNNDGTLTNGPTWQTEDQCISGKCLYFDGSDDITTVSDSSSLDFTSALTLQAWGKIVSTTPAGDSTILSKGLTASTENYSLYIQDDGDIYFEYYNGGFVGKTFTVPNFNTNQWYHYSLVVNDTTISAYRDGIQIGASQSLSSALVANSSSLQIGSVTAFSNRFAGFIDEVKIYPYARSAGQIAADYNARGASKGASATIGSTRSNQYPPVLSNGLVAYYKMDESSWNGTSGEVKDSSGQGNNGTSAGGATKGEGKYSSGGSFDGTNDYVDVADSSSLRPSNVSVSLWFKTTQTAESVLVNKPVVASGFAGYQLDINGFVANKISFNTNRPSNVHVNSTSSVNDGLWHHVVGTDDGSNIKIYVDGNLQSTASVGGIITYDNNLALQIGRYDAIGYYFNGSIDEVRIYNRAISASEVAELYAQPPVGYWDFENGSGTSLSDKSGNGNTGTLTNGPTWASGRYGKALSFDGTDDYVSMGNVSAYNFTATSSFSSFAWIKKPSVATVGIIAGKDLEAPTYTGWDYRIDGNDDLGIVLVGPSLRQITKFFTTSLGDNQWHYVGFTYNGGLFSGLKGYVDGIEVTTLTSSTDTLLITDDITSSANFTIGNRTGIQHFTGQIDDVRIYNYARTQAQIIEDMNAGHPGVGSPVGSAIAHWKFDEGQGTTANNAGNQGSTLNGTLTNMDFPATASSGWTNSGKFGKGLVFDGTNDYVNTNGVVSSVASNTSGSVSLWVNFTSGITGDAANIFTMSKGDTTNFFQINVGATDKLRFCLLTSSGCLTEKVTTNTYASAWHHVVVTSDGSTTKFYVDGTQPILSTNTDSGNWFSAFSGLTAARIGGLLYNSIERSFNGSIDEVKIYNYALTADQVKLEYNKGSTLVLGNAGNNSTYQPQAANQEYCVPGDTTSCAAPVGEWKFEDGSGTSANDTSGNANTGTLTNGPTWTKGKVGQAMRFDGTDDYVDAGTSSILQPPLYWTLSTWVKSSSDTSSDAFISNYAEPSSVAYGIAIQKQTNTHKARIFSARGTGVNDGTDYEDVVGTVIIDDNVWHHIVGVQDSVGLKLYVDGKLDGSQSWTNAPAYHATNRLNIGALNYPSPSQLQLTNGSIDDVRIYNYARTPAQIAWEYNKGAPVGHWKMDECQGTVVNDSSGNGNTGTITIGASGTQTTAGTCTGSANEAWKDGATGKINSSLDFDGTDDYVSMGDPSSGILDFDDDFSFGGWFKTSSTGTTRRLFMKGNTSGTNDSYQIYLNSSNQLALHIADGTDEININSTNTYNDGNWHFAFATIDSTMAKLYVDGIVSSSASASSIDSVANAQEFFVGAGRDNTGINFYFSGSIDDVRIYNYALTPTQIKTLYTGGAVRFGPGTGTP